MIDDNSLDTRLKQYALTAREHPPQSKERQKALNKLIQELQDSGELCRPSRHLFQKNYTEVYAEARQLLFQHICRNIEQYNPEKKVLQWVNFLLKNRFFFEACRLLYPQAKQGKERVKIYSLDTLKDFATKPKAMPTEEKPIEPFLSEIIMGYIAEDPDGLFKNTYTQKPEANFQYLAQQVFAGYKWREISSELDIAMSTLSSFYSRQLKQFSPLILSYLKQ